MTGAWVLIVMFVYPSNTMTSFTQEFSTEAACVSARENVRNKTTSGRFLLLTCEKK